MFGVDSSEFLLIAVVALVVIGPKDLPKAMRVVGYWVGKARGVSRSFRQGFDNMVREAELEEMEKRWAAENARIMAEHPASSDAEAVAAAEPVADQPQPDAPVMVEKPVVVAAPEHKPAPQPDSTPS
ncbi:Sec-independent protein translocase protein TatB [Sphingomonas sp. RP10(2022)]|uniref:Sec-independent protein translocase protein TatB n=1 Tax=Sphingomonas liriopis TaxID=2949094 RepID=A0A9X2HSV9_9SPHN|nr:Sec-independent protein translocase protein TatB [Sphingomonas liriopis]MCP3734834.1 Sec-independent protein translocase protein TatB [Sphingomonas liriopis]